MESRGRVRGGGRCWSEGLAEGRREKTEGKIRQREQGKKVGEGTKKIRGKKGARFSNEI